MILASVTDALATFATDVVGALGLVGIFALMLAESACIPIPSEATMLFAGFGVARGHHTLLSITVAGVLGNLVGSWIAYTVGSVGRTEVLESYGRRLRIKPEHLAWADRWFARYGQRAVFFSRLLPVIRTFISLPAGVAQMPLGRFSALTALGSVPWVFALGLIGEQVGSRWTQWRDHLHYVDYAVAAASIVALAVLLGRRRRSVRSGA